MPVHACGLPRSSTRCIATLWIGIAFLNLACGQENNPLLIPQPDRKDSQRDGSILLHGGGGQITDSVLTEFLRLAGGTKARIVVIPSGLLVQGQRDDGTEFEESSSEFEARFNQFWPIWAELKGRGVIDVYDLLYTDNRDDCDRPEFVARLQQATGVFMPGAYQGKLAWRFTHRYPDQWEDTSDSLFQRELRSVVSRGGVVMGYGGGASALADIMIKGGQSLDGGPMQADVQPGLGLIQGAIIDQNFDAIGGRLERLTGLLKDTSRLNGLVRWPSNGRQMIGLGIEQATALVIQGDKLKVLGNGFAHIFLKGNGDRTIRWQRLDAKSPAIRIDFRSNFPIESREPDAGLAKWSNPLGMPEPIDPRNVGTVVLHGGGPNQDLIGVFPRLTNRSAPKLVHCPAADTEFQPLDGESRSQFRTRLSDYFDVWVEKVPKGECRELDFLSCRKPDEADHATFLGPLLEADGVWFSGGDQAELARLFVNPTNASKFELALHSVVQRGGVIGGSSAGTAIMARTMIVSSRESPGRPMRANVGKGLSVLKNAIIEQHLGGDGRGGRLERFTSVLLSDVSPPPNPDGKVGLAIEEETWMVIRGNRLQVYGKNKAHVFLVDRTVNQIAWHELVPGDHAIFKIGPTSTELELEEWATK